MLKKFESALALKDFSCVSLWPQRHVSQHPRSLLSPFYYYSLPALQNNAKVAVLGASGGIGQPLSLLLKNSPLVSQLNLYDIAHTPGVAADLSHIETRAEVKGMTCLDYFQCIAWGFFWGFFVFMQLNQRTCQGL